MLPSSSEKIVKEIEDLLFYIKTARLAKTRVREGRILTPFVQFLKIPGFADILIITVVQSDYLLSTLFT